MFYKHLSVVVNNFPQSVVNNFPQSLIVKCNSE